MRPPKQVVAKRGCTCCGTGCVIIGAAMPLSVVAVWNLAGVVAAAALWPLLVAGLHGVRFARWRSVPASDRGRYLERRTK